MRDDGLNEVINNLTLDLQPVRVAIHPALKALLWLFIVVAYIYCVLQWMGVRSDVNERLADSQFLYEIITVGLIGFSAACASVWLSIPDLRGNGWIVVVPIVLGVNFLLWLSLMGSDDLIALDHAHWNHCFEDGLFMAGIPALVIAVVSMRGNTTHPYKMAAMNTVAGASAATIGLRFSCSIDSIDHAVLYHVLPFVVLGTILGFFARKIYRW